MSNIFFLAGCLQSFNDSYNSLLNKLCTGNDKFETYIAGDFNINLLNYETHNDTNTFLNTAFEHHLYPIITRPTRFSNTNTTLIDNIFTNNPGNNYYAGLLLTDLSDLLPIVYVSDNKFYEKKKPIVYRIPVIFLTAVFRNLPQYCKL